MNYSDGHIWLIILALGVGTFLIRFSFLGIVGNRKMPDWVLRHLRYTPVALIPGLVAPLVLWPPATGGETDPARLIASLAAVLVGFVTKSIIAGMIGGGLVLALGFWLL